jgi:pimeloyl-ACP methyl ester carboxylesterase
LRRGWKILIAVVAVLAVLLTLNTIAVDNETGSAEVTADGGQVVELSAGDVQVVEEGPTARGREGPPIVLLHCYSCSLHWWDRLVPRLSERHRVVRLDLLGHGGSDKPKSGYSIEEQGAIVAEALNRLDVEGATVVGHSMGAAVATALAAESSELVDRLVVIDQAPDTSFGSLPLIARLAYVPVLGQLLDRITPDFAIKDGYADAFAPDYDIERGFEDPDQVVEDFDAMTYTSFDESAAEEEDYVDEIPLDDRITSAAIPLLVIFGDQDQLYDDPEEALAAYEDVPGARRAMIEGAGHSPNVERPEQTARLILEFANEAGDEAEVPQPPRGSERGKDGGGQDRRGKDRSKGG